MPELLTGPIHAQSGAQLKPGSQVSTPPLLLSEAPGPNLTPVTSISGSPGQTLALSVEKVDQGLGVGQRKRCQGRVVL